MLLAKRKGRIMFSIRSDFVLSIKKPHLAAKEIALHIQIKETMLFKKENSDIVGKTFLVFWDSFLLFLKGSSGDKFLFRLIM